MNTISHLPQLPASVTVDDLLAQGTPIEEAIAAASKGEPKGMADSLRGLYKSAQPASEVDLTSQVTVPRRFDFRATGRRSFKA